MMDLAGSIFTWEDSYAIARALHKQFPAVALEEISLEKLYTWVRLLPGFEDDPVVVNDRILLDILRAWIEEALPND